MVSIDDTSVTGESPQGESPQRQSVGAAATRQCSLSSGHVFEPETKDTPARRPSLPAESLAESPLHTLRQSCLPEAENLRMRGATMDFKIIPWTPFFPSTNCVMWKSAAMLDSMYAS